VKAEQWQIYTLESDIVLSAADVRYEPGRAEPVMPISESREISISWQTVSDAALRSRSINMFINPESMDRSHF